VTCRPSSAPCGWRWAGPLAEVGQQDDARAQFDAARALFLDLKDDEGAEMAESARAALARS